MRRFLLVVLVLCLGASISPASAATVEASLANARTGSFNSYYSSGSYYVYGGVYGWSNLGASVTSPVPPAGPPTVTPGTSGGTIYVCISYQGCDNATLTADAFPVDPAMIGGSVSVTAPSNVFTGGTLSITFDYAGVGPHTYGGYANWGGNSGAGLPAYLVGSASVQRSAISGQMTIVSSSLGGVGLPPASGYLATGVNGYVAKY